MANYKPEDLHRIWRTEIEIYRAIAAICERHGLRYYAAYGTTLGAVRHGGFIPWDDDMDVCMPRKDYDAFLKYAEKELPEKLKIEGIGYSKGSVMPFVKIANKKTVFVEASDAEKKLRTGIFVDIFPMDTAAPTETLKRKQRRKCMLYGRAMVLAEYGRGKLPEGINPVAGALVQAGCGLIHGCLKLLRLDTAHFYRAFYREATRYETGEPKEYVLQAYFSEFATEYAPAEWFFPTAEIPFEDITVKVPKETDAYLRNMYGEYMKLPPVEEQHNHYPIELKFEEE